MNAPSLMVNRPLTYLPTPFCERVIHLVTSLVLWLLNKCGLKLLDETFNREVTLLRQVRI